MVEIAALKPDGQHEQSDPPGPTTDGSSISSSSVIHRRIEFHLARKPFSGFINGGGDFRLETLNPGSDSQRPNPNPNPVQSVKGARRPDGSEFLENGLDPELCLGITVRRIGAGLQNLGNTCFLNSVLQCLTHTEPLAAYLQSGKHQNSCKVAGFCALCAIQKHVSRALQSTGRILAPKDLVSNLRCISRNFRNCRQEDAHEYMVNLLESMHKCCLPSGVPSESPSAYDKSLVHKIFGGRLRSQVKCMQCHNCSNTFDPFLDLSLEIAKADSLQKALVNFTAAEQLDGGERQYQCQKCKHKVKALKQLTVHKAPYVLTIHLKRFRAHIGQKIDKKVQFSSTLDLKPFVSGSYEGDLKYTLYGVLVHYGFSTHSGHYYSFVRTSGGTWYNLDDNRVTTVGERTVLDQRAYMLFYVRDRRNSVPRKSVDAVQKENMKGNNCGNKSVFSLKQGFSAPVQNGIVENRPNGVANVGSTSVNSNGLVPNGTVENKSNGTACSSALTQKDTKDALMICSTKQVSNGLVQHRIVENGTNGVVSSAAVAQKDEVNIGSTKQGHNGSVQSASVDNKSNGASVGSAKKLPPQNGDLKRAEQMLSKKDFMVATDSKTQEEPSSGPSSEAASLKEAMTEPSLDKLRVDAMVTNAAATPKKDLLVSVEVSPNSMNPSNSKTDKLPSKKTSQKSKPDSQVGVPILVPSVVPSDKTMKIDPSGLVNEKVSDGSMEQSSSLAVTNGILNKEACSSIPKRKIRMKIQRRLTVSMRLGTNILFGGSSLQKKKFKKSKRPPGLVSKNLSKEHLLASNCISSDLGPSTSGQSEKIFLRATRAKKRATKSHSKRVDSAASAAPAEATNSFGGSVTDDEKFRDRTGQNGADLVADKQSEKASSSSVTRNLSDDTETIQNGTMCLITGGLDETYVPRWDETDLPTSQIAQSKRSENISIGYVGDEWDEEYDMGRRKKVRTFKHSFDGPNLFQEIASKKIHSNKKPRMDQSSSANQPFRI